MLQREPGVGVYPNKPFQLIMSSRVAVFSSCDVCASTFPSRILVNHVAGVLLLSSSGRGPLMLALM